MNQPEQLKIAPANLHSVSTTLGFTGHRELDNLYLMNLNARVFDPTISRCASCSTIRVNSRL